MTEAPETIYLACADTATEYGVKITEALKPHGYPRGAIEYTRADLARPVTVADLEQTRVGDIGNHYGGISIRCIDGKPEWSIEDYDGPLWEPCPIPVFLALRALSHEGGE